MDSHELVQLGGVQAIWQGKRPFIDARTQYGPGQQFVGYKLVQATELSLRGVRASHLIMNFVTIACFFSLTLFAFGWTVGGAVVLVSLFISPLQVTSFVGWGLLVRWFAPFLVGALTPRVLGSTITRGRRYLFCGVIGIACGALAWMSQENGSTSVITMLLVLSGAIILGRLPLRDAFVMTGVFVVSEVATLLISITWLVGPEQLGHALELYRSGSGLVFGGMTNSPWSGAETFLTQPLAGRGPAYYLIGWRPSQWISGWGAAYRFTPIILVGLTALSLYPVRRHAQAGSDKGTGQLLGILAAATTLELLTLFRADSTHFIGMSMALAPLMVLSVAYLPARLSNRGRAREAIRGTLLLLFFVAYPFLSANTEFRFRTAANIANTVDGIAVVRQMWGSEKRREATSSAGVFLHRLGYRPAASDPCCRVNKLTYAELQLAMDAMHSATAGRSVYVDTKGNYSAFKTVASAVYFLADLNVGTTFVEPMMSIWTDTDVIAVRRELAARPPDCLLSGGPEFVMTGFILKTFGNYTTYRVPGNLTANLYCRVDGRRSRQ